MKKLVLLFILLIMSVLLAACGTSKVIDYTGKEDSADKNDSPVAYTDQISDSSTLESDLSNEELTLESDKEDFMDADSFVSGLLDEYISETTDDEKTNMEEETSYEVNVSRFDIYENYGEYSYRAIVEVENTGESNIYLSGTAFDIEDANGHLLQSDSMISCCPDVIFPGEKGFLYTQYGFSLEGISEIEGLQLVPQYVVKATSETPVDYKVSDVSLKEGKWGVAAVGRVTNTTEVEDSLFYIQAVYYDNDGNVIGIDGTNVNDFLPGRTVSFEFSGMTLPRDLALDKIGTYEIIARESFLGW